MSDVFLGSLMLVPYTFEPYGWATCDGRLLQIVQNPALFALIGNQYGGDGKTTFALPDLRGRVPIAAGQGPGLQNYIQARPGGDQQVTLTAGQMPSHSHDLNGTRTGASLSNANGGLLGRTTASAYCTGGAANTQLAADTLAPAGSASSHENRMPYLQMRWIIALQGIFPTRP